MRRATANKRQPAQTPPPPTVPDLVDAPELAAVILLEHALGVVTDAVLAEHPTLIDDFAVAHLIHPLKLIPEVRGETGAPESPTARAPSWPTL